MNVPLAIVISRALATIPTCALLALGRPDSDALALAVFVVAVLSDAVDGRLARARGQATALGAALDPLADKILIVGVLAALALRALVPAWAVAIVFARETVAVALRATARAVLPATADGKIKTVAQVLAAATAMLAAATRSADLARAGDVLIASAVALTIVSGVRLILRAAQTTAHAR